MYAAFAEDFSFGGGNYTSVPKRRAKRASASMAVEINNQHRRKMAIARMTEQARRENELYRKPCPTCHNLVRPELQQQHNEAYHAQPA